MSTEPRDHFVYRTYDKDGNVLYIGCTMRLDLRWKDHRRDKPEMYARTERCRIQGPYTKAVACQIERDAIRAEQPPFNGCTSTARQAWAEEERRIAAREQELIDSGWPPRIAWSQAVKDVSAAPS